MWCGVGGGKTWLMDMFFYSLPGNRKLRLHFHRFILRVHEQLTELQGQENPLESIAAAFKLQTDVLCFDEFFVSDITDAMLLGTLGAADECCPGDKNSIKNCSIFVIDFSIISQPHVTTKFFPKNFI